ncbi:hypothetical protein GCM10010508_46360 [Streptomyces naganishii JCM 4654]|uniref:Uncharacterized protein n=2 Tax=Streptomyces naganishii TaxID=285447 RepID=A0A919CWQ4_9ACTN|nr:hypothetical protein GCM10010508_46360 [Streptomyces naganishii JCM 4654]
MRDHSVTTVSFCSIATSDQLRCMVGDAPGHAAGRPTGGRATGLAGNLLNGEGDPGAQQSHLGSTMGCNNAAF